MTTNTKTNTVDYRRRMAFETEFFILLRVNRCKMFNSLFYFLSHL